MLLSRRSLIRMGAGGAALGAIGAAAPSWATTSASGATTYQSIDELLARQAGVAQPTAMQNAVRRISLLNLHTDERCSVVYSEAGQKIPDALSEVNRVLRDFRTGEVHPIDTRLLDLMADLAVKLDTNTPFHIISGYRSSKTNAMLNGKSDGVATKSLHMQGMAVDIRVPGRQLAKVRDTALAMSRGGVGYYAKSDFVHVDVGRVRRW
jgi:uncharacterized protein YcbK (DUF882 family)